MCSKEYILTQYHYDNIDEIIVGNPLINSRANVYMSTYFQNLQFAMESEERKKYDGIFPTNDRMISSRFYMDDMGDIGFDVWYSPNEFWCLRADKKEKNYIFLFKLTPEDFNNGFNKTVHLIFGGIGINDAFAVEFLIRHFKKIYKLFKASHYAIAIEVNIIDKTFDWSKEIVDLTPYMFHNDKGIYPIR